MPIFYKNFPGPKRLLMRIIIFWMSNYCIIKLCDDNALSTFLREVLFLLLFHSVLYYCHFCCSSFCCHCCFSSYCCHCIYCRSYSLYFCYFVDILHVIVVMVMKHISLLTHIFLHHNVLSLACL